MTFENEIRKAEATIAEATARATDIGISPRLFRMYVEIAKAAEIACDDTDLQCEDGNGKLDALRDCLVVLGSSESLPDPSTPS